MAIGASSRNVRQLILAQTARPVLHGLLAGAGLAASLATLLMATPAGATITEIDSAQWMPDPRVRIPLSA